MSVKVRLSRTGGKNEVSYRVVATDSRSPRDGRNLEVLGWYDPKRTGVNFELKMDRIEHWKSRGACLSDTVKSLIRHANRAAKKAAK
jgi:small subunit ribosomal protein S16